MKYLKSIILSAVAISLISFTFGDGKEKGIQFDHLTYKQALEKAKKENKIVFIDVYATWCGPCKYLSRNVFTNKDVGTFHNENFINLKLDGEREGRALMGRYRITGYPTMLYLDGDGKVVKKIVGAVGADKLLQNSNNVIKNN